MNEIDKVPRELEQLATLYMFAKQAVINDGYASEIDWQDGIVFDHLTETDFLREAAWVVLSSGMSELVIRRKFPQISDAFLNWESASQIAESASECSEVALRHFRHQKKINSILTIAIHISESGFEVIYERIRKDGPSYFSQFPYFGPATSRHLAKNIGLQVAKPDRHLTRISERTGYCTPERMCADIANLVGDKISVVDIVLWRYATLHKDYPQFFRPFIPLTAISRDGN